MKIIVIVDDDQLILRGMIRLLKMSFPMEELNYALLACEDAASALVIIRANTKADYFVITDGHMPGMSGIDFVRLLMEDVGKQVMGCYLCTGDERYAAEAEEVFKAYGIRAQAVYGKIVATEYLQQILDDIRRFLTA